MSDLIIRSEKAIQLLTDSSQPKWDRFDGAMRAFSGLELSVLEPDIRSDLEAAMGRVNGILDRYTIDGPEDHDNVSEDDLDEILHTIHLAAEKAIDAEVARIARELDEAGGKLPVSAIQEAREHRERIIPVLMNALENAIAQAKNEEEVLKRGDLHFFSLFLLTEFEVREAVPLMLEALSLPVDRADELFGDAATMMLPRILARFWDGDFERVDVFLRDPKLAQDLGMFAAETYVYLVRDGHLTREDAVERLRQHLRWAIDQEDGELASGLVLAMHSLAPREAMDEIREAYRLELVEPFLIGLEEIEEAAADEQEFVKRQLEQWPPSGMPDTIEELKEWVAFKEPPKPPPREPTPKPHIRPKAPAYSYATVPAAPRGNTTIRGSRDSRVGRNDPCPCGSGKKYKKCCMRK